MEEKYIEIEKFNNYEISNLGRVRNKKTKRILKQSLTSNGYCKVRLYKNKVGTTKLVHRLVYDYFIGLVNNKVINHKDYNRQNNNLNNLELVTQRENCFHGRANKKYSSKYFGVTYYKRNKKWGANILVNRKNKYLGLFETELEAKSAYNKALLDINQNSTL